MDNLSKKSIEVGMRILSKNDEEAIKLRQTYQNNDLFVVIKKKEKKGVFDR